MTDRYTVSAVERKVITTLVDTFFKRLNNGTTMMKHITTILFLLTFTAIFEYVLFKSNDTYKYLTEVK